MEIRERAGSLEPQAGYAEQHGHQQAIQPGEALVHGSEAGIHLLETAVNFCPESAYILLDIAQTGVHLFEDIFGTQGFSHGCIPGKRGKESYLDKILLAPSSVKPAEI